MPALKPYFVKRAAERLQSRLTPAPREAMHKLIALLQPDGKVRVPDVHAALFALNDAGAANKALSRLIDAVNAGAQAGGVDLKLKITQAKRGPREIWFEGPAVGAVEPAMPDLNAVPQQQLEHGQRAIDIEFQNAVVLITFNKNETEAVFRLFAGTVAPPTLARGRATYHDLGMHGAARVLHTVSQQGPHKAQQAAQEAIDNFAPLAVIAVGIAFGMDETKQQIGDVLISASIRDYAIGRHNKDGTITPNDLVPPASSYWVDRANTLAHRLHGTLEKDWPTINIGSVLSGPKLIDNEDYRNSLRQQFPTAIGGEMEGTGLFAACEPSKTDWLVVKAIADWADGNKSHDKEARQKLAAGNAARILKALFDLAPLYAGDGPRDPLRARGARAPTPAMPPAAIERLHNSQLITRDLDDLSEGAYQQDARGHYASLAKADLAQAEARSSDSDDQQQGIEVLLALRHWVEDLKAPPLFALLGEYGMGKTITSQRFTQEQNQRHKADPQMLPALYFDLRHVTGLDRGVPTLPAVIEECIARGFHVAAGQSKLDFDAVMELTTQGAVIVFDGLDEALVKLSEADGQTFTNNLLKLIADARAANNGTRSKLLVTCRTQYFRTLRDQKTHFTGQERGEVTPDHYRAMVLLPFSDEQVQRYLQNALPEMDVNAVMALVGSVHNLTELTRRPYTLKLVGEYIPEIEAARAAGRTVRGVTLYRAMAQRWLERDKGKHHIKPEHKLQLAAHLAAEIWRSGARALPVGKLENWFHRWLESEPDLARRYRDVKPDQLEEDLRTATFLCRDDSGGEKVSGFRFAHTSLQEFFLAEYLLQAMRDNAREGWQLPQPSVETFDFLGQLLEEAGGGQAQLLDTLHEWCVRYRAQASENLLAYALRAHARDAPMPDLSGIDLRGVDLSRWRFGVTRFKKNKKNQILTMIDADFTGAALHEASFVNVNLQDAHFDQAALHGAEFIECDQSRSSWANAQLAGAKFRHCALHHCALKQASAHGTEVLWCTGVAPDLESQPGWLVAPRAGVTPCLAMPAWLQGHKYSVGSVAYAPGGAMLASASDDCTVRLWDARSGKLLRIFQGHEAPVLSVAYAPNAVMLASASRDGTVRLWDARSCDLLRSLEGHGDWVWSVAYAPDGLTLASASRDGTVRLWDPHSGELLHSLLGHENSVRSVAYAADGETLASASQDCTVRLWDACSGQMLRSLQDHEASVLDTILSIAYAPGGATLASASHEGLVRVWKASSGKLLRTWKGHTRWVLSVAYSPDGETLASASHDKTVRLWDARSGKLRRSLQGHEDSVQSLAYSPDGATLASASADGTVRISDARNGKLLRSLRDHINTVWSVSYAPDGATVASASRDQMVRLWDAHSGKLMRSLKGHEDSVLSVVYGPDGATLASASADNTVRLWDAHSGKLMRNLKGHEDSVLSVVYGPDGATLASASADKSVRLWDLRSGKLLHSLNGHGSWVLSVAYSPDGMTLASASAEYTVQLWDVRSGKLLRSLKDNQDTFRSVAYAPDGATLASASSSGMVRLWDADSGKLLRTIRAHDAPISAVAYAPDGAILASASQDHTVRLWDTRSGTLLCKLQGHEDAVRSVAYAPNGTTLVSVGDDGTVRIWNVKAATPCWHSVVTPTAHATFDWVKRRLVEASGDAWRYLYDQTEDENGQPTVVPWETYGPLSAPSLLQDDESAA